MLQRSEIHSRFGATRKWVRGTCKSQKSDSSTAFRLRSSLLRTTLRSAIRHRCLARRRTAHICQSPPARWPSRMWISAQRRTRCSATSKKWSSGTNSKNTIRINLKFWLTVQVGSPTKWRRWSSTTVSSVRSFLSLRIKSKTKWTNCRLNFGTSSNCWG